MNPTQYDDAERQPLLKKDDGVYDDGVSKDVSGMRLWEKESWAIPVGYFTVGVVQTFFTTPLTYYLVKERDAGSEKISIISIVTSLPWCLKTLHGVVTDCYPIYAEHRRPWFIIGWSTFVMLSIFLWWTVDALSVPGILFVIFLQHMAFLMGDVTADSLVVERSKLLEKEHHHGEMQSTCYLLRFTGGILGATSGALFFDPSANGFPLRVVFLLSAVVAVVPIVLAWGYLKETVGTKSKHNRSLSTEYVAVVNTLSHEAVYRPMFFIFIYNVMQWGNAAWPNFLVVGRSFSETDLATIAVAGSFVNWLGVAAYKKWMLEISWRGVYLTTTVVCLIFAALQVVLIMGWNRTIGIGDLAFALGDNSVTVFVTAIQFLPTVNMYISMCPKGAEGSVYALLTTMSNLSSVCGSNITTLLAAIWPYDISNAAFARGDNKGMLLLSIFTTLAKPLPLLLIHYLPASYEEQETLKRQGGYSTTKGTLCLTAVIIAIIWTLTQNTFVAFYL